MTMMIVFRFAPSPNGYLHLGHALSALLNADMARAAAGEVLLRIEDIDATRCRPEYEAAIYEDLAWLGLTFAPPVRKQSQHYDDYRNALAKLDAVSYTHLAPAKKDRWAHYRPARNALKAPYPARKTAALTLTVDKWQPVFG